LILGSIRNKIISKDEGKHKSGTNMKVLNRDEGGHSSQIEVNK